MLKFLSNNPYFNAIRNIKSVLDPDQKRRSIGMIGLMLLNAFFDVLSMVVVLGMITTALKGGAITRESYTRADASNMGEYIFNSILRFFYQITGAESEIGLLFFLSFLIFLTFMVKNAVSLYINYIQNRFAYNISLRLNKKMFRRYYDQGYLFIQDSTSGKNVYKIVDIPMRFAQQYLMQAFFFSTELVVIAILCIGLFFYKPGAILLLMAVIAPVFLGIYSYSKNKIKDIGYERNKLLPINYSKVIEAMKGYVDIKLSNKESKSLDRYVESQKYLNSVDTYYFGVYNKIHQKTNDIIFGLGIFVIFGYAYFTGMTKETVLLLLGFFAIAAYKILPAVNRMMNSILGIKNHSYVIDELQEVVGMSLEEFETYPQLDFHEHIKLKDVSFTYPESRQIVLDKINLSINRGESIGIIGESGSGKSTLLKILLRLIRESSGEFRVDDNTLLNLNDDSSFQKNIGYVAQDIFILNGTLRENIAFGEVEVDAERLEYAIRESQLAKFVSEQELGLDMHLGEGGVKLSGGQKQRVGIARALYKNAEILVFDEVTSALDPETEKAIVESINHIATLGKTIIIVAHRITTLEKCDRIIELEHGKIVREPKYSELIKELVEING